MLTTDDLFLMLQVQRTLFNAAYAQIDIEDAKKLESQYSSLLMRLGVHERALAS